MACLKTANMSVPSLDLQKLLQVNGVVSLVSTLGYAPPWNLPIMLYGHETVATAATTQEHLINLTGLVAVSFIADIIWLIVWREDYRSFTAFLLLVIMALKAVTFLALQSNKPFAGFEGGEGSSQTIWSMPNGVTSQLSRGVNANSYQGYRFADDEDEETAPQPKPPAAANTPAAPAQPGQVPTVPLELLEALGRDPDTPESSALPDIPAGSPLMDLQEEGDSDGGEPSPEFQRQSYAHNLHARRHPQQQRKLFWAEETDCETDSDEDPDVVRTVSYTDLASKQRYASIDDNARTLRHAYTTSNDLSARNRSRSEPFVSHANAGSPRDRSSMVFQRDSLQKADVVVAVVGPKGVGKSTVIGRLAKKQNATVMVADSAGHQVTSYLTSLAISANVVKTVEILEVDSNLFQYSAEGIIWPDSWPPIEGALICYDAQNKATLAPLRKMLHGFWLRGGIKMIVLACKSANTANPADNHVDPNVTNQICNPFNAGLVELTGGLEDKQHKMRNAFKWVVRSIAELKGEIPEDRLKTTRAFTKTAPRRPGSALSQNQDRANDKDEERTPSSSPRNQTVSLPPVIPEAPPSPKSIKSSTTSPSLPFQANRIPDIDLYYSKEDLIDKFLYAAVAENDEPFVAYFITIFRRFARPTEVLNRLLERYHFVDLRSQTNKILVEYAQMRLCNVLHQWMSAYPGDFVTYLQKTNTEFKGFLEKMLFLPHLNHYAIDLLPFLKVINRIKRDPELWALPDTSFEPDSPVSSRKESVADSHISLSSTVPSVRSLPMDDSPVETLDISAAKRRPRGMSESDTLASNSSQKSDAAASSLRSGRRLGEATLLDISNEVAEADPRDIATQITRFTWQIFSDICPRDLIRYVLSPHNVQGLPDTPVHLRNPVNRSIRFLNFLSDWTASLILVQNKSKHRTRLFAKFIAIASALRDLENFDSLMGVLAGMNSQPVYRLSEDLQPLKDPRNKKEYNRFQSLNKLMSNSKSFAAYRMALGSSSPAALPYLGCHLQDIIKINESKDDHRNALVNWSKCSQLAKSAAVVAECVKHDPKLTNHEKVERLIVDVPVHSLEEDTLYQLSYAYQPRSTKSGSKSQRIRRMWSDMVAPQQLPGDPVPLPSKTYLPD